MSKPFGHHYARVVAQALPAVLGQTGCWQPSLPDLCDFGAPVPGVIPASTARLGNASIPAISACLPIYLRSPHGAWQNKQIPVPAAELASCYPCLPAIRLMHENDAELMRRANCGDSAAFAELVRQYQPALRRVAASRLGSIEAAEDVVQETFLAAYKSRHTYDEQFGFRTWLWTILLNQCRRYAGRQARKEQLVSLDASGAIGGTDPIGPADAGADPAALAGLLAQERRELLERLLGQLSTVQADALRLRFYGDLKFQEIADAMQCSLCTAKNRVRWGLLKLSELVQHERAGPPAAESPGSRSAALPTTDNQLPSREQRP